MGNSTAHSTRKVPNSDRSQMIAEAAYFIAEQRGFSGGDPVRDWLDAEAMIDQMTSKTKRKHRTK